MPAASPSRPLPGRTVLVIAFLFLLIQSPAVAAEVPVVPGHFYLDPVPGLSGLDARDCQQRLDEAGLGLRVQAMRPLGTHIDFARRGHGVDLSRLVRLELDPVDGDAFTLAGELAALPWVSRCEPVFARPVSGWHPDDPGLTAQWHLDAVDAVGAWQIRTGNASVKVAILDTGTDMDHEDLMAHLWVNPGEDLNGNGVADPEDEDGLDSDGNGLIDDLRGWDYVDLNAASLWPGEDGAPADNWPDDFNGHGTHCSGIAAAVGDNGTGVAGLGFGCSILPIRVGYQAPDGQGYVGYSIEGLMLAAEYDADVVSMSYGSTGFSSFESELFFMLAQNGMVCVGAAGNENSTDDFYPAAYSQVLAVAATRQGDSRASYSNHGDWVDVAAPGSQILATTVGGGYGRLTGTSMACPLTAGLCGLLKSAHPEWNFSQVKARIQATCDPVTSDAATMGAGRINAMRALDLVPRVIAVDVADMGRRLRPGVDETVQFTVRVPGEDPLGSAVIHLSSDDPELVLLDSQVEVGMLFPQQQVTVSGQLRYTGTTVRTLHMALSLVDGDTIWSGESLLGAGQAATLLIDADRSANWDVSPWLRQAFTDLGQPLESFSCRLPESPLPSLGRFEQIVLITGSDLEPELEGGPLPDAMLDSLLAYADNGGRLLLSGQNLADALPGYFLETRVGATRSGQAAAAIVHGVSGESTEGMQLLVIGSGGAENQEEMDQFFATTALPVLSWSATDLNDLAGVRSPDGAITVLGFGLEGVNADPEWATSLPSLLTALLELETGLPDVRQTLPRGMELLAAWPNPFNPELGLSVQLPTASRVELAVWDLGGRRVATLHHGPLPAGLTRLAWRPQQQASGVYLVTLDGPWGQRCQRVTYLK
ncbi:MAG: S8 family serine peptidase [Candidatus Cloacimonetes bacterium]|nr:S8 family serine peptidase [Candidatus Cloacimonadota bacterium]